MKNHLIKPIIICASIFLMAFQCDEEPSITMESEQANLILEKSKIEQLANASICNESIICKFIAFGSKPCGGPWTYLIYSTSIDVDKLEKMVENYNKKEAAFNLKYNIMSDCSYAVAPKEVKCENNKCIALF